jgi:hypothetical protein
MAYLIYGKRTCLVNGGGPDKKFAALDAKGHRVTKLADAMSYAEKEDAQAIIDKMGLDGCEFEIRKAK